MFTLFLLISLTAGCSSSVALTPTQSTANIPAATVYSMTVTPLPRSSILAPGEVIVDKPELIYGTWKGAYGWAHVDSQMGYMIFRSDGSYTMAPTPEGKHGVTGKYNFVGAEIHIVDEYCPTGGDYEIRLLTRPGQPAMFRFFLVKSDCSAQIERMLNRNEAWEKLP